MKSLSKGYFRLAILATLALVGYGAFHYWNRQSPLPATTAIRRGDIESTVMATGTMRPQNMVAIGAQATGRILSLAVKPGQHIRKGDVVALIDSTNQRNELDKAQATLRQNEATRDKNRADLELAEQDLARNQIMIGKNAIARAVYDKALATVKSQQAQLASSEAAIVVSRIDMRIAEAKLSYTRITAPIDGTVLATVAQEGQTLNAEQSVPTIAILGQLDTMRVETDISEADITKLREGLPLYFTISGGKSKRYEAKLDRIEPAPDSVVHDKSFSTERVASSSSSPTAAAVYYEGIFSVPNPDGLLRTYMTAEVHIVLEKAGDVLLAPVSALRMKDGTDQASVRILTSGGQLEERNVETGITDKINIEIRSGLQEGDRIVIDNQEQTSPVSGGNDA